MIPPSYATPGPWADDASCRGAVDAFVSPRREEGSLVRVRVARAKSICQVCPVLDECREWALTDPDPAYGLIAGGMTPRERSRVAVRRAKRVS